MAVHPAVPHKHRAGGGSSMKSRQLEEPNIVKVYHYGNTTVRIASNAFARTPEEKEKVIHDMHMAGWAIIEELQQKQSG